MSPSSHIPLTRRELLRVSAASTLISGTRLIAAPGETQPPDVCIYTEQFQRLPIPKVCEVFKRIGANGLDLTVRPGGHIKPEDARKQLPVAVATAKEHGLRIMMLTTSITSPDRNAESILATCQELGIRRIKMGYYGGGEFGQLKKRLEDARRQLSAVVKLAAKYEVLPCVHVHSGLTIPSNGFMLHQLLKDIPPDQIGAYLDSCHMTITGGAGGWRQAIELLSPWISLVALKNFQWHKSGRNSIGQQTWRTDYCRLEDGIAPIPAFVETVHQAGYRGFYTLHTEYKLPVEECIRLTTDDYVFLQKVLAGL
jgi:sugar phosphate isomerase/epimerase